MARDWLLRRRSWSEANSPPGGSSSLSQMRRFCSARATISSTARSRASSRRCKSYAARWGSIRGAIGCADVTRGGHILVCHAGDRAVTSRIIKFRSPTNCSLNLLFAASSSIGAITEIGFHQ